MQLTGRKALITGAGSGIGRALALRLADHGGALVLTGRRSQPLHETARLVQARGGTARVIPADLADPAVPARLAEQAAAALGGLDLLVNNAGNVRAGELEAIGEDDIQAMVAVDLLAALLLTRAALPHLRAAAHATGGVHGSAAIVGISSGIALVGLPYYAVYAGVKAGLARFDEALRRELHGTGIYVATAYPGATATPMMDTNAAGDDVGFGRRGVEEVADAIADGLREGLPEINTASAGRRSMQDLNRTDPAAVDEKLAPLLPRLRQAVSGHRSM
ncbi:SDR family NAD(P)-dependent oxidoreductase [Streptomyces sp. MMS24-I2-30]|uniref:SDR family NAD(P)-dependent oxidoreductase n=1 Tax=Streptomyces sp. MMS24-I2-30 TaxID=3351564 RepID=UPI003896DB56